MSSSQKYKQSKYFESLKLNATIPDLSTNLNDKNNVSPIDTISTNNSVSTTSITTDSNPSILLSPLRSAFISKFDGNNSTYNVNDLNDYENNNSDGDDYMNNNDELNLSNTFGKNLYLNSNSRSLPPPSSPPPPVPSQTQYSPFDSSSIVSTPKVNTRLEPPSLKPSYISPIQNRFVSNPLLSKSHTPSPSKRFTKSRLNNTENINYQLNSSSNAKTFIDKTSYLNKLDRSFTDNNEPINDKNLLSDNTLLNNDNNLDNFDNLSLYSNNDIQMSFFKQPMQSPIQIDDDNKSLFSSPISTISGKTSNQLLSPITQSNSLSNYNNNSLDSLPLNMQIICNSRAEHNIHSMNGFSNVGYMEFWNLTPEEGKIYKEWNKSEFEIQSLILEIFTNLKKIRFNLHRLIFIYGLEFKDTGFISDNVYDKTFEVLQEFYYFLDKLVVKKLKPLFDDHFFVNDTQVLKILTSWFKQLKLQYHHISSSVVYLSKLSSNEDVRKLIIGISKKDFENSSNRSAVSPIELFNSYFVKLFTSIELLFDRLKIVYKDINNLKNFETTDNLQSTVKNINNISDSTSELEKKISFNEKLSYKTEIDFSHMEMVDMFNEKRKSKEPIKLEYNLNWADALIAPFDNYLVILHIKSNYIKDEYVLNEIPISIQYLETDSYIEGKYKIIIFKDIGHQLTYYFRKLNDITIAILDRFIKDLKNLQNEFWLNLKNNNRIDLKIFNSGTFISKVENFSPFKLSNIPDEYNLIKTICSKSKNSYNEIGNEEFEPLLTNVLSCDYFSHNSDKFSIVGTTFGIFIGIINDNKSFRKVHQITNVKKLIVLNNDVVFCIGNESLYHLSIEKLYHTYQNKLPPCDINIFQENKRNISDFTLGYQSSIKNNGSPYLFAWHNKIVYYTELLKENNFKFNWQSFKTHNPIVKLQTVYANNFAVGHIIDGSAVWNLSKLSDIRAIALNQLDVKDILKNEIPIAIFPYPNKEENISEVLIVFSNFCTRMKNVKGKYIQSDDEIIWFGMKCENASFDCEEKVLIAVGKQSVEIRILSDSPAKKSELIGCLVGSSFSLINDMPGKAILKVQNIDGNKDYEKQIIFKIRKLKKIKN